MQKKIENINRRKLRNRFKVKKSSVGVPRLSVFVQLGIFLAKL